MIELRWLTDRRGYGYATPILQYRQKIDTTIRAGLWHDPVEEMKTANWQWSEWIDVPEVKE